MTIAEEVSFCLVLKRIKGRKISFASSLSATTKRHGCMLTEEGAVVASLIISSISSCGILYVSSYTRTDLLPVIIVEKSFFCSIIINLFRFCCYIAKLGIQFI